MKATVAPVAALTPARTAAPLPRLSPSSITESGSARRVASAVPSSEPSSTTMISAPPSAASSASPERRAATVGPMRSASR